MCEYRNPVWSIQRKVCVEKKLGFYSAPSLFQYASSKGVIRIINYPKYVGMAVRAGRTTIELSTRPKCSSLGYICSNIIIRVWIQWRLLMASLSIQMFLDGSIAITRTHLVNYYQTVCHIHETINLRILITLTRR